MPNSLIGFSEGSLLYKKPEQMRAILGFTSMDEMKAFIDGPNFKPLFDQYAEKWIRPQQAEAYSLGNSRGRGCRLDVVEKRMLHGERPGSNTYSSPLTDKSTWDVYDDCTYMVYHLKQMNVRNANGLFYGKALSEEEMLDRVWGLIKYQEFRKFPPPSRRSLQQATASKSKAKWKHPSATSGSSQSVAAKDSSQPGADNSQPVATGTVPLENDPGPGMDIDQHDAGTSYNEHIQFPSDPTEDRQRPNLQLEDESWFSNARSLTNAQRVAEINTSPFFDIAHRFWQIWLIDRLVSAGNDQKTLQDALTYVGASNEHRFANSESIIWQRQVIQQMSEDSIIYEPVTEDSMRQFDSQQVYFDNEDYQREDIEYACHILRIPWSKDATIFRMPGMALSQSLRFWQPVAVTALIDFASDDNMRGCVLADAMGLGKTWIIACFLLWVIEARRSAEWRERHPARPTLILTPVTVINQWVKLFDLIAPGKFQVYKYHGDTRISRFVPVANEQGLELLTRKHYLFNGKEQNAHAVVFSTLNTWNERHGPKAQNKYHRNLNLNRDRNKLDTKWDGALMGCFENLVVDEAHVIKSLVADGHLSILWLHCYFHIFVTATPCPNTINDWAGYMPFIESFDADEWWSAESLAEMKFEEDENPFAVKDDHPAAKLRMTARAVKDWILRLGVGQVEKGQRLAQIWKKCLIRRTFSSTIPFKDGRIIGDDLPRTQAALIACTHLDEELDHYQERQQDLTAPQQGKKKWSLGIHRQLTLLTMWTGLPALDSQINLKSTNVKKTLEKKAFYKDFLHERFGTNIDAQNPGQYLQYLLHGAPKMRALLRNVSRQVLRDSEKVIVFCQLPASMLYMMAVFRLLNIDVVTITASQTQAEREKIIDLFNRSDEKAMILVMTFAVGSTGLNLQEKCWRVHIVESPYNIATSAQGIGRAKRIGNPSDTVYVYEYFAKDTFDDKALTRNIDKAIPSAMAELNQQIFHGDNEGEGEVDVGEWVIHNNQLLRAEDAVSEEILHILTPYELITFLLKASKGENITVR